MGVGVLPGQLRAQYYDSPGLGERPVASHPQDYKPLGIRAGSFMLHPGAQLAAEYTDNAFYASDKAQDDYIFHVRPYINAQSTWSRHSLNVSLAADIARYKDFSERDYEDYLLGINGRVDVRNRSFFTYGLDYMDLHEGLNNRASEQGVRPTRYNQSSASVGYDHTFNRLQLAGSYYLGKLNYDNVLGADGEVIDNQDRDRSTNNLSLRAGYQFKTDKQVFATYSVYKEDFDQRHDRNGYERGGDGYSAGAGLAFTLTGKLNGNVAALYHDRSYDDPRLPNTSGWGGSAALQWNATKMTSVYGMVSSSVEDTTESNSSGILQTVYSLRADHALQRYLQLSGYLSYRASDYQPIDRTLPDTRGKDNTMIYGLGLNWFINRHAYLNASYQYEDFSSILPNDDYTANTAWLGLALEY
jgi:hypothetical protein